MALNFITRNGNPTEGTDVEVVKRRVSNPTLVNDYVALHDKVATAKKALKQDEEALELLKSKLRRLAEGDNAKSTVIVTSGEIDVNIGPKAKKTEVVVSTPDLRTIVGDSVFNEVCSFPIGQLKKYCSADQLQKILRVKQEGVRPVKVKR